MHVQDITFGVEIECYVPVGRLRIGGYHNGLQVPELPAGWNAQRDGSLSTRSRGKVGCEVVSPVLRGSDGLRQIKQVVEFLHSIGATVNARCGLHVHVGVGADLDLVRKVTTLAANFETAIYASTGTDRRERGGFCSPISAAYRGMSFADRRDMAIRSRYHLLNLTNFAHGTRPTVEFRAFAGTLNFGKIAAYVRLCVGLTERAAKAKRATDWTAKPVAPTSPIYRKAGAGQTALTRLFYQLGWIKGRQPHTHGDLTGDGLPTIAATKRTLKQLAAKYDAQR